MLGPNLDDEQWTLNSKQCGCSCRCTLEICRIGGDAGKGIALSGHASLEEARHPSALLSCLQMLVDVAYKFATGQVEALRPYGLQMLQVGDTWRSATLKIAALVTCSQMASVMAAQCMHMRWQPA